MAKSVSAGAATPRSPRLLGVLVGWPVLLLIWNPVWLLASVAVAWGIVYAVAPRRADRWPWWLLGQWLTLVVIFSVFIERMDDVFSVAVVGIAAIVAVIAVAIWMTPVAIAELHRTQWNTTRPPADDAHRPPPAEDTAVEPTTLR